MQSARMIWAEGEALDIGRDMRSGGVTGIHPTREGHIYISANTPRFWKALCERPDCRRWADERYDTVRKRAALANEIVPQLHAALAPAQCAGMGSPIRRRSALRRRAPHRGHVRSSAGVAEEIVRTSSIPSSAAIAACPARSVRPHAGARRRSPRRRWGSTPTKPSPLPAAAPRKSSLQSVSPCSTPSRRAGSCFVIRRARAERGQPPQTRDEWHAGSSARTGNC